MLLPALQTKVAKSSTDLLVDQLREVFQSLSRDKVPTSKLEKRLEEVAHRWDDIKKAQPQVKSQVEPIQVCCTAGPHLLLLYACCVMLAQ